jgi:hypothetical protein
MLLAAQMTWQWYRDDRNPVQEPEPSIWEHERYPEPKTVDDLVDDDAAAMAIIPPEEIPGVTLRAFTVEEMAALDQQVAVVQEYEPDPLIQELASELETAVRDRDDLAEFIRTTQSDLDVTVQAKTELEAKLSAMEADIQLLLARIAELEAPPAPKAPAIDYVFLDEYSEPDLSVYDDERLVSNFDKQVLAEPEVQVIAPAEELTITVSETAPKFKAETVTPPETAPRQKGAMVEPEPEPKGPEEYITDSIVKMLNRKPNAGFGAEFPDNPTRGDMFLRIDFKPTRLFKWNDISWIEVNKNATDAYSYNDAYIQYLAEKLLSGEYQLDDLTEMEQQQVQVLLGAARG